MKSYSLFTGIRVRGWSFALVACAFVFTLCVAQAQESKGAIYGYVADTSGELVGGAEIVILEGASRVGETFTSRGQGSLVFDGGFFISDLAPGTYKLEVRKRGYNSTQVQAKVAPGAGTKVVFTLSRVQILVGVIQGKVTVARRALEGATVSVITEGEKKPLIKVKTAADGSYSFDNLEPGKYIVVVEWDKKEVYRSKTIEVKAKKTENVQIALEPAAIEEEPGSVSGKVSDKDEKPVAGATISVKEAPEGAKKPTTWSDQDGEFQIKERLKPGKYVLRASKGQAADEKKVTVTSGRTTKVNFRIR